MVSRNYSIDILRLLLSFAVVVIHVHSGKWYDYVDPICRLAVPVFFIISGYFIYDEGINKKVRKGLAKISKRLHFGQRRYMPCHFCPIC